MPTASADDLRPTASSRYFAQPGRRFAAGGCGVIGFVRVNAGEMVAFSAI